MSNRALGDQFVPHPEDLPLVYDPADPSEHIQRQAQPYGPQYDAAAHRRALDNEWSDTDEAERIYDQLNEAPDEHLLSSEQIKSTTITPEDDLNDVYEKRDHHETLRLGAEDRVLSLSREAYARPRLAHPKGTVVQHSFPGVP